MSVQDHPVKNLGDEATKNDRRMMSHVHPKSGQSDRARIKGHHYMKGVSKPCEDGKCLRQEEDSLKQARRHAARRNRYFVRNEIANELVEINHELQAMGINAFVEQEVRDLPREDYDDHQEDYECGFDDAYIGRLLTPYEERMDQNDRYDARIEQNEVHAAARRMNLHRITFHPDGRTVRVHCGDREHFRVRVIDGTKVQILDKTVAA